MDKKVFNFSVFFDFEKRHDVFKMKRDELFFWDIIRYDLYYSITRNGIDTTSTVGFSESLFEKIKKTLITLFHFFKFLFFNNWEYLFFCASRGSIDNLKYDQNLNDIIQKLGYDKCVSCETFEFESSKRYFKKSFFNPVGYFFEIFKIFFKNNYDFSDLLSVVKNELGNTQLKNEQINNIISKYKTEYMFYMFVFKIKRPKLIFLNQNGIQKGLFSAAKECNITVVEVQHCVINEGQIGYSYNVDIEYDKNNLHLPSCFFSYSDFWTSNLFYPVDEIFAVGNSFLYSLRNVKRESMMKGLVVVSANIYGKELKDLILKLCEVKRPVYPIYFKLHPNQYYEKDYFVDQFSAFSNVHVISNDKTVYDLLRVIETVLIIQSTVLYEAHQMGNKCLIYKKQEYEVHKHVFNEQWVHLIENCFELDFLVNSENVFTERDEPILFKDFDLKKFNAFLDNYLII